MKILTTRFVYSLAALMVAVPNAFATKKEDAAIIDEVPAMVIACNVQAFVMPVKGANAGNQIIIHMEMLEKGLRIDRILPHNRIKEGSFYVFGTVSKVVLASQATPEKLPALKLEMATQARFVFRSGLNYGVAEPSIRMSGCELKQLF